MKQGLPGIISGEALLVSHGYQPAFIRDCMTMRGYYARIVACAKQDLLSQQSTTIAMMVAIGSLFDKNGATSLEKRVKEGLDDFDKKIEAVLRTDEQEAEQEVSAPAHQGPPGAPQRSSIVPREKKAPPTPAQLQKMIRQLDATMSAMTGQRVMNPLGGYNATNQFSQFDVTGTPLPELLQRVVK